MGSVTVMGTVTSRLQGVPVTFAGAQPVVLKADLAVWLADAARVGCIILGAIVIGLYIRVLFDPRVAETTRAHPGFVARISAMAVLAVAGVAFQIGRFGQPLAIYLPLVFTGLVLAIRGLTVLPRSPLPPGWDDEGRDNP